MDATTKTPPYEVIQHSYSWLQPELRFYPDCTPQEAEAAAVSDEWGHVAATKGEYNEDRGAFVKLWKK